MFFQICLVIFGAFAYEASAIGIARSYANVNREDVSVGIAKLGGWGGSSGGWGGSLRGLSGGGWGDEGKQGLQQIQLVQAAPILKAEPQIDYIAYPKYSFKYGVQDPKTGDHKEQREERDGDVVKGEYSLAEPDGTIRTVKYIADKKNGFNAQVIRSGHAIHPQIVKVEKQIVALPIKGLGGLGGYGGLGGLGLGLGEGY